MADPLKPHIYQVGHHGAKWLRSKYASLILAVISFSESAFAPILIDPFLIALILAKREAWLRYITISIISAVIGGVVAYFLGYWFYDLIGTKIINFYGWSGDFVILSEKVNQNAFVFILLGSLTPIPYKLVAIAGGMVQVNFVAFLAATIFGRILRIGLVGWATYAMGPHALPMIRRHLVTLAYILCVVLLAYFFFSIF